MRISVLSRVSILSVLLTPVLVHAQFVEVSAFVGNVSAFISNRLVPLVFAIALLVFIWGVFRYFIFNGGDETSRQEGRQLMLWGIIGLVVMVSVWGIVNLLAGGLGLDDSEDLQNIPDAPLSR